MRPVVVNGAAWRVLRVKPGDPRLVDRTGSPRLATTDPATATIHISSSVVPPLLDRVLLHETAHVATISHGLLGPIHGMFAENLWIQVEELLAQVVELYGIEAIIAASESIGRPLCIRGFCGMAADM